MPNLAYLGWRLIRASIALVIALGAIPARGDDAPQLSNWRYQAGDDRRFADPAFDDSGWRPVRVPGGWQTQGLGSERGFGWYRVRFTVPPAARGDPLAVLLGRINNADEVFLNGVRIGGTGVIEAGFVDARGKARVYPLPAQPLRADGENVLAVRVFNWFLPGGIVEGPVALGPAGALSAIGATMDREFLVLAGTQLGLVLTALAACLVLYAANRRELPLLVFSVILATWATWIALDSLPLLGVVNRWMAGEIVLYLAWLVFSAFCAAARLSRAEIGGAIAGLLLAVAALVGPSERLQVELYAAVNLLVAGVFVLVCWRLIDVFRRGAARRWVLLAGTISSVLLMAYAAVPVDLPTTLNPGMLLLLTMTVFLGVDVYRRAADELRESAHRVASIQARERSRIARDLHDDIAQTLGAVRLSLQILHRRNADPTLAAAVDQLGSGLDRVRGLAHGLGDPFTRRKPFGELVRQHCARLAHQCGVEFRVDLAPEADARIVGSSAEHLFAILQEASGNAVRHGEAKTVSVAVTLSGDGIALSIADEGHGFDPSHRGDGIGLWTMQQRALLLGGTLSIDSAPGRGTVVAVEAPLRDNEPSSTEAGP